MPGPFNSAYAATWARSDQAQAVRGTSPSTLADKSLASNRVLCVHKTAR
jgi:hypothetical protein